MPETTCGGVLATTLDAGFVGFDDHHAAPQLSTPQKAAGGNFHDLTHELATLKAEVQTLTKHFQE
eukprot:4708058-Amphidinium_carterae.2